MPIYYKEDHQSFGEFMVSDQVRDPTAKVANAISRAMRGASRRSSGPGPHMADLWEVNEFAGIRVLITDGHANPRVRVDVFNPDIAAAAEEFSIQAGNDRPATLRAIAARYGNFTTGPDEE